MANKAVELLISLKTAGTKELDALVNKINSVSRTAENSSSGFENLESSVTNASSAAQGLGRTSEELASNLTSQSNSANSAANSVSNYAEQTANSSAGASKMSSAVGMLKVGFAGLATAAAAAGAAVGAGLAAISDRSEELNRMSNTAQRLGLSMEELSAADAAASQAAGMNWENVADGLDDLNEIIVDFAKNGSGEAADLFAQFEELDPKELIKMDSLDQLKAVTAAMKDLSTQERSQLLDQLGSDNLRGLTNSLSGANAEFFEMIKKAQETGMVISEIETDRITNAGKDIGTMGRNFGILKDQFLAKLAPAIEVVVEHVNTFLTSLRDSSDEGGSMSKTILTGIEWIISGFNNLRGTVKIVMSVFYGLRAAGTKLSATLVGFFGDTLNTVAEKGINSLQRVLDFAGQFSETARKLSTELEKIRPEKIDLSGSLDGLADEYLKEAQKAAQEGQALFNKTVPDLVGELEVKLNKEKTLSSAKETTEEASKKAQDTADDNPVDLTVQADISAAKKALEDTLYKLQQKHEQQLTRDAISNIEHEKKVALKSIDARKEAGKIGDEEYYDEKLKLEIETNNQIASMRKSIIDADIQSLERQRDTMLETLKDLKKGTEEYYKAKQKLEQTNGQISGLENDKQQIDVNAGRRNQLATIDTKSSQADIQRKEAEEQRAIREAAAEAEAEQARKRAEAAAARQKELDQEVASAKMELLRETGHESEVEIAQLQEKYGAMLSKLEAGSEDAQIVQKLLDVKTAQVELDDLMKSVDELKGKYESMQISKDEYNRQLNELEPQIQDAAARTGNEDTIAGAQETVQGAQNEGDTGFQIGEEMTKHVDAAANAMSDFITGTKSAKEAFKDFAKGVIAEITKMIIKQLILNAIQAASGGGGGGMGAMGSMGGMSGGGGNMGGMMGSMGSMAGNGGGGSAGFLGGFMSGGLNHTGGHIGAGSATRHIPTSWLSSMKRYHTGGEILSPGEVPIVAQEGEYMLDKYDIRNPKNGGSGDAREGNGGGGSQAVNITNVVDNASIAGSMQSTDGKRAIINVIKSEAGTVKSILN